MSVVRFRPKAPTIKAGVAQLVEQLICNQQVAGSSPITSSIYGEIPERPKGADCKSAVFDFDGSNPSLSTKNNDSFESLFFIQADRLGISSRKACINIPSA